MDDATALALNALNLALYRDRAAEWSAARTRPWRGFARIVAELAKRPGARLATRPGARLATRPGARLRVLDVGCGNGRFAQALATPLAAAHVGLEYVGVDASAPLLEQARARAPHGAAFALADFVASAPDAALPQGPFDAVVLFGVLHTVPGAARRRALLAAAASRLAAGGLLALTRWRFADVPDRRARIVPWEHADARAAAPIDARQLEPGDHLLRFGARGALRYCHDIGPDELDALLAGLPLERADDWCDDGPDARENHYRVLRRI